MLKVIVVTLYSGENEFLECCKSVESQVGVFIDHRFIKYFPKQEAHQKLYQLFNESREEFDYLVKLDADMAFSNSNSLLNVIDRFNDGVDIVSATVHDGITDTDMQSFNIFSKRCFFHYGSNDPLFTDKLTIDYPGIQYSYIDKDRNVIHAFNPSPFQAFMFGVHRALKVVQPGAKIPGLNNSYHQRIILNHAYECYKKTRSAHSKYALFGATLVFQNVINDSALFQKSDYLNIFEDLLSKGDIEIDSRLKERGIFSLVRVLGLNRFVSAVCGQVFRKIRLLIL